MTAVDSKWMDLCSFDGVFMLIYFGHSTLQIMLSVHAKQYILIPHIIASVEKCIIE